MFVVRIFVPAGDEKLELTGVVEHSVTGRSEGFEGSPFTPGDKPVYRALHDLRERFFLRKAERERKARLGTNRYSVPKPPENDRKTQ
jgi:hypothetical protein